MAVLDEKIDQIWLFRVIPNLQYNKVVAAAALIVSIKQPPLSLSVSNYAIIGFLLSSTQLRKTLDFCYHESVTHAGISSYGRVKYVGFYGCPPCAGPRRRVESAVRDGLSTRFRPL